MKKSIFPLLLLLAVLYSADGLAQPSRFTISGYVYEKGSRETLVGVNVYDAGLRVGTSTNTYGFYTLTLPADSAEIIFSYVGYGIVVQKLKLTSNVRLDIEMDSSLDLDEVVILGERINRISTDVQMSRIDIPVQQARNIPSLLGEKDLFKVLQLMPGVQSGNEGTSGFYVRGGGPDQNLIILDDAPVYNASHLFGFFSVFNGDAVKNLQLYKGGFPARFGGRLSSVLDIQMKDGNKEKLAGEAGIGIISSRLTLEGPIIKNKASFLVSGRRTYIDALIAPFMPKDERGGYFFYDLNTKLNFDINPNNRIFVSSYMGRDKFFFRYGYKDIMFSEESEGGLFWQNATATVRWNHIFNDRIFANASFIFSDYTLQIYNEERYKYIPDNRSNFYQLKYNSGIKDFGFKYDASWHPITNHLIRFGVSTVRHKFTPSAVVFQDDDAFKYERNAEIHYSLESGIYAEDEMSFGNRLKINPGIRFSHFYADNKYYSALEPRFSSNYILTPGISWKASWASMNQYVHLLSSTGIGLPTDLWVPSTSQIKPQKSKQVATGFAFDRLNKNLEFSIEGYYKKSDNIIAYKEGASFLHFDDPQNASTFSWQDNITDGQAWAYGVEFLLQRKSGKLSGWVGYTLSWIEHQFDELNFKEKFFAKYDRRHDLSIVGIYEYSPKTTVSATWIYASGNNFDLGTGRFPVVEHPITGSYEHYWFPVANVYDKKNSFRASSYQRLDIGIQFHKDLKYFGQPVKRTLEIGAYNAYSRKNPFFYFWMAEVEYLGDTYIEKQKLMQVSIFPMIPSISYNFKF
jgi:hypothetical protein